jgi:outer membrane protein assembly factor BamA
VYEQQLARLYVDQASVVGQYPLSPTRRFEVGLSANHQSVGVQSVQTLVVGGQAVNQTQSNSTGFPSLSYGQATVAYVGDYSTFGFTSPIAGARYRLEASPVFGGLGFTSLLADYRRYLFVRPVTVAVRGLHYGRYGADAERSDWLQSLFLGYGSLVRGYSAESFSAAECTPVSGNASACPEFDRLIGSRIAVASAELRIPLFGPRPLALIPASFLPIEVSPFVDAGVAWSRNEAPILQFSQSSAARVPVVSTGLSARMNLFGAMVLEIYYAYPFQRPAKGAHFGFQLQPGW